MKAVIKNLPEGNLDDHPCFKYGNEETVETTKNWLRKVYRKFGPCVKVAYVDDRPAAMVQYAPMDIFPHVDKPDAHETIVVHCIYVADKRCEGKGIAKRLIESLTRDMRKPHPYLDGARFRQIVALAGKDRPGPAGPIEFFHKMGFAVDRQIGENDVLVRIQLCPESQ